MELLKTLENGYINFLWDTNSLNKLAADSKMIQCCYDAIGSGHCYYITTVQERELMGVPDRTLEYDNLSKWGPVQHKTLDIIKSLGFRKISCIALFYHNFTLLDGSMRILEPYGPRIDMFNSIYNHNNHHKRDATIAEAAIYHGCTLITGDKRLRNKVNLFFPNKAITFDEYKNIIFSIKRKEE